MLTLIQCGKSPRAPVLLYDKAFWQGMIDWMRARMLAAGLIGAHDLDRLIFCNAPTEAVAALARRDGSLRSARPGNGSGSAIRLLSPGRTR